MADTEMPDFDEFFNARAEAGDEWDAFVKWWGLTERSRRRDTVEEDQMLRGAKDAWQKMIAQANQTLKERKQTAKEADSAEAARARGVREKGTAKRFAETQSYKVSQAQYRRERDEANMAYRQQRDAERDSRRDQARKSQGPSIGSPGPGIGRSLGGWAPDRAQTAKFIMFVTVLAAITAATNDIVNNAPGFTIPGSKTKVPAHLRSAGGAFVAGAVALIVNEVYPALGALLGAGILTLVVVPNLTTSSSGGPSLLGRIGNAFGAPPVKTKAATSAAITVPTRDQYGNLTTNPVVTT